MNTCQFDPPGETFAIYDKGRKVGELQKGYSQWVVAWAIPGFELMVRERCRLKNAVAA